MEEIKMTRLIKTPPPMTPELLARLNAPPLPPFDPNNVDPFFLEVLEAVRPLKDNPEVLFKTIDDLLEYHYS